MAGLSLLYSFYTYQRLEQGQLVLAQQNASAAIHAQEARALAKESFDLSRDAQAKLALAEARIAEIAQNKGQFDALLAGLTITRDDTFLTSAEAILRMAAAQSQISGTPEPLVISLKNLDNRLVHYSGQKKSQISRAIARDLERLNKNLGMDIWTLEKRIDSALKLMETVITIADNSPSRPSDSSYRIENKSHDNRATQIHTESSQIERALIAIRRELRDLFIIKRNTSDFEPILTKDRADLFRLRLSILGAQWKQAFLTRNTIEFSRLLNVLTNEIRQKGDMSDKSTSALEKQLTELLNRNIEFPAIIKSETLEILTLSTARP